MSYNMQSVMQEYRESWALGVCSYLRDTGALQQIGMTFEECVQKAKVVADTWDDYMFAKASRNLALRIKYGA